MAREDVMNHSMYSADRATHLKIVVIGLLCAIVVAVIGIFAHVSSKIDLGTAVLVKAGQPTTLSGNVPAIR
jgi:ABC-type proline/glycine betaine transport system permease subunit